ncbi:MAG TPA: hypothetical protein VG733_02375 [Chthoniobacteraceae bacterium]|nr:hypothetical protein [Chthoniobacteraceae bacterium]
MDNDKAHIGRYYMLPKALLTIEGTPDSSGGFDVDASVTVVADSRYRYYLRWKPNPTYDDFFNNIDVDGNGLLSTLNYTVEDKTPAIVNDLATTAVNLGKIINGIATADTNGHAPQPFKYTFDPFDQAEYQRVEDELEQNQHLKMYLAPRPQGAQSALAKYSYDKIPDAAPAQNPQGGGIFYHPPTTIEMLLVAMDSSATSPTPASGAARGSTNGGGGGGASATPKPTGSPANANPQQQSTPSKTTTYPLNRCHLVFTVPDVTQIACFKLDRSVFTKRELNLGFVDGMPRTLYFKQPSVSEGISGMISQVTTTIGNGIGNILPSVKVNSTSTVTSQEPKTNAAASSAKSTAARTAPSTAVSPGAATGAEAVSAANANNANVNSALESIQNQLSNLQQSVDALKSGTAAAAALPTPIGNGH